MRGFYLKIERMQMANINVDGKEYDLDKVSNEGKAQLLSIQFVDQELARLNAQIAALQTARIAYGNELKKHLEPLKANKKPLN